jgi:predicted dehydrogenase
MSEDAKTTKQGGMPRADDYARCVADYYREVAHGPTLTPVERAWELHDVAENIALLCAEARLTARRVDDRVRWEAAYQEWLRVAVIHAEKAHYLKERP